MDSETQRKLFLQLILQNQQMALISMGKTTSPVSNKIEKNMTYAKVSIDTLEMLQAKTKGNLSKMEEQYLVEMITQLKIDYTKASDGDHNTGEGQAEENRNSE
ncbi:MAG: DUF1844 domain-containing protein [Ignavibacteria bacterium]|jgi:hypothetical protein